MKNHYTIANLPPNVIEKIQSLEQELKSGYKEDIILIAYQDKKADHL